MTLRTLPLLALAIFTAPVFAQDRTELSGETRGQPVAATLLLEGDEANLSLLIGESTIPLRLVGQLEENGEQRGGVLRSLGGLTTALTPGKQSDRWTARLRRDGPLVSLKLGSGYQSIKLEGLAPLGERDAENEALIRRFYEAFVASDGDTMASCYAPDARFTDPVFPDLRGGAPGDMWRMLCESKPRVEFSGIRAGARYGIAHWEAHYELLGNKIHNVIEARFELRDGEIVRHVDQFDFKAWSVQAFGQVVRAVPSFAVKHVLRQVSAGQLKSFQAKRKQ